MSDPVPDPTPANRLRAIAVGERPRSDWKNSAPPP